MNLQSTGPSGCPRDPLSDRYDGTSPVPPSRSLIVAEHAFTHGATAPRSTQPVTKHLAIVPAARRISMVENVAIHIFSGTIEFGPSDGTRHETNRGVGRHGWPLLLNRDQLCEYLGASWRTVKNVLTVRPVDMGANVVRYSRVQIDEWVATLPPRFMGSKTQSNDTDDEAGTNALDAVDADIGNSRGEAALARVRARAGGSTWRKMA